MRIIITILLFAMAALPAAPSQGGVQQSSEIRLIIQGDDMGAAHGINVATIRAYKEGILRTTNLITPGAWMPEAARLLEENPGLDVGVHLALTAEWANVKWRPLTGGRTVVDANGYFFPMVYPSKNFPKGSNVKDAAPDMGEIERELRAQIELAKKMVPRVSYMSTHMGFGGAFPELKGILARLSAEYGLPIPSAEHGISYLRVRYSNGSNGSVFETGEARAEKLAKALEGIGPGTWLMVEHAGMDTPEMQAMSHTGYVNVGADRAAVTEAWISPKVKEVVKRRGIKLVGYPEVFGKK